jgi:hypothetical protein
LRRRHPGYGLSATPDCSPDIACSDIQGNAAIGAK